MTLTLTPKISGKSGSHWFLEKWMEGGRSDPLTTELSKRSGVTSLQSRPNYPKKETGLSTSEEGTPKQN